MRVEIKELHGRQYKTVPQIDGLPTAYHIETTDNIIEILEEHRKLKTRLRFHWGDIETGRDYDDQWDVKGRIGVSRGSEARYPILVYNARSMGGVQILTHCIVKITTTEGGRTIYQHPNYHTA